MKRKCDEENLERIYEQVPQRIEELKKGGKYTKPFTVSSIFSSGGAKGRTRTTQFFADIAEILPHVPNDKRLSQKNSDLTDKQKKLVHLLNYIFFGDIEENFIDQPLPQHIKDDVDTLIYVLDRYARTLPGFDDVKYAGKTLEDIIEMEFQGEEKERVNNNLSQIPSLIWKAICQIRQWDGGMFKEHHREERKGDYNVIVYLFDEIEIIVIEIRRFLGAATAPIADDNALTPGMIDKLKTPSPASPLTLEDIFDNRRRCKGILSKVLKKFQIDERLPIQLVASQRIIFDLMRALFQDQPLQKIPPSPPIGESSNVIIVINKLLSALESRLALDTEIRDLFRCTLHEIIGYYQWEFRLPIGHPGRAEIGRRTKELICAKMKLSSEAYNAQHPKIPVHYSRHRFTSYDDEEFGIVKEAIKEALARYYPDFKVDTILLTPNY